MTASFITELDSVGVTKNVLTELLDTDKEAPAGVIYANGAIVSTAAPLPATDAAATALLTTMDADTGAAVGHLATLAAAVVPRATAPAADEGLVSTGLIRDDALSSITGEAAEGQLTLGRVDGFGRHWIVDGGARDAAVDSIQSIPIPGIAAKIHRSADYTTSQTGVAMWDPDGSHRAVVTEVFIEVYGTSDGNVFVWIPAASAADTAYTPGTDQLIAQIHGTPSTRGPAGVTRQGFWPAAALDYPVRVTTTGDVDCTVAVDGYESLV